MRHRRRIRKLGRKTAHRQAMLRNMVTSLLEHGRIVTTVTRAKELRRLADKMVTLAKDGSLHARRQVMSVVMDKKVVAKLFNHWASEMSGKNGGYTRIVRIGPRRGDAAMMCYIEMATDTLERPKGKKPARKVEDTSAESIIPQAPATAAQEEEIESESAEPAADESQEAPDSSSDDTASQDVSLEETKEPSDDKQKEQPES